MSEQKFSNQDEPVDDGFITPDFVDNTPKYGYDEPDESESEYEDKLESEYSDESELEYGDGLEYDESGFEDDEVLEEKVLTDDGYISAIRQGSLGGNIVVCGVDKFYDENGKVRGKNLLRSDPPVFFIESSDGGRASFVVTPEVAQKLSKTFTDVNKAFYGIDPDYETIFSRLKTGGDVKSWIAVGVVILVVVAIFIWMRVA